MSRSPTGSLETKYESIRLGVYDKMKAELDQLRAENKMLKNRCTVLYRALDKLVRLSYGFFSTSTLQSYQDILDINREYK